MRPLPVRGAKAKGLDDVRYGAVLSCAAKAMRWTAANALLLSDADAAAYTATMSAAEKASQWVQGLRHFEEMALRRLVDLPACTVAARGNWQMVFQMHGLETDAALSVVMLGAMGQSEEVLNKLEA